MSEADERQSDLAVMDANEYKQKRRLRRILDIHDSVEDAADKLFQLEIEGVISRDARNLGLQKVVQKFIRECWNLLQEYDHEDHPNDPDVWGEELGSIRMEHRQDIVFCGLDDFLRSNEFYSESWTEGTTTRHGPNQTQEYSRQYTVPEEVSWEAYLLLRRFLDQVKDVEVKFEALGDDLPSWGFESEEEIPDDAVVL